MNCWKFYHCSSCIKFRVERYDILTSLYSVANHSFTKWNENKDQILTVWWAMVIVLSINGNNHFQILYCPYCQTTVYNLKYWQLLFKLFNIFNYFCRIIYTLNYSHLYKCIKVFNINNLKNNTINIHKFVWKQL